MIARHKGFSLLEILVAFAIMAVALTVVLRIFGSGVGTAVRAEDYTIAVQIAESLMARTGVETRLEAGETQGVEVDKYYWWISIRPLPVLQAKRPRFKSQQDAEVESNPLQLVAVKVRVSWNDVGKKQRMLELNTLKLLQEQTS